MSKPNKESNTASEKLQSTVDATKSAAADMNEKAKEQIGVMKEKVDSTINETPAFGEKLKGLASDVKDKVGNAFESAKSTTVSAANATEDKAHELKGKL